jgi:hypothetical protein
MFIPILVAASLAVPVGVPMPKPLRAHTWALRSAEELAEDGAFNAAIAVLEAEVDTASFEAQELLKIQIKMLRRVAELEEQAPGIAGRISRYIFRPPTEHLPKTMQDVEALAAMDSDLALVLQTPSAVRVTAVSKAVSLMMRGALVDAGSRAGLPLRSAEGPGSFEVTIDLEDVEARSLLGDHMHSYTTHIVVSLDVPGHVTVNTGAVQQLLGINQARAVDVNMPRLADRVLTAFAAELIRRSLLDELRL